MNRYLGIMHKIKRFLPITARLQIYLSEFRSVSYQFLLAGVGIHVQITHRFTIHQTKARGKNSNARACQLSLQRRTTTCTHTGKFQRIWNFNNTWSYSEKCTPANAQDQPLSTDRAQID